MEVVKMKKVCILLLFTALLPWMGFAQVIAVADFTTEEPLIMTKMAGVTDIFRNALFKNNMIRMVDRKHHDDIMKELRLQNSGVTNPNTAKAVGELLNADYYIFGTVTRFGQTTITDSTNVVAQVFGMVFKMEVSTSVAAQMVNVETGQIVATAQISCATWNDYMNKIDVFAQNFINKLPLPDMFTGSWEAILEHDGFEDNYLLTFRPGNRCTVTVDSYDANNVKRTQTATGTYSYGSEVLSITVNFRRENTIQYLTKIEWRVMISLANDRGSFNMVIPVSSRDGAKRNRVTFYRAENQ
jgi:hypothetical protein